MIRRTIKLKTVLPYQQGRVWQALTDATLLGNWLMENDIKPVQGHYFTFRMRPQKGWDGITHCQIIAIEPQRFISYTYRGQASGEKALACAGIHSQAAGELTKGIFTNPDTVLSFTLEPTCAGTILYLEHSGYDGFKLILISLIRLMGWKKQLKKKLPKVWQQMPNRQS
jgi:uncharacterized protein YndB with AHSA1/START domain